VMRALARAPEYRPESAETFAAELGATPTAATAVDRSLVPTKPMRRVRSSWGRSPAVARPGRWVLAALAVVAAAVTALVLALSLPGGSKRPSRPAHIEELPSGWLLSTPGTAAPHSLESRINARRKRPARHWLLPPAVPHWRVRRFLSLRTVRGHCFLLRAQS